MLRNVISKLGLSKVPELPIYDIIVWMSEAMAHIGGLQSLETTTKKVNVVNYMGKYPLDMYALIRVKDHPRAVDKKNHFLISEDNVEVEIEYQKFPVDDDGYPLFPGDPSTKDAIVWYVAMYLAVQDLLPNKRLSVPFCDSQWQWYCGQARAEGFVPSMLEWEKMVNVFYRLIPKKDEYDIEFAGLNTSEDLNLDPLNNYMGGSNTNTL